jgi:hypothetical protein
MAMTLPPSERRHSSKRDEGPAEAYLLFQLPFAYPRAAPDLLREAAEKWMRDRRDKVAPPHRTVLEQAFSRVREGSAIREERVSREPRVRDSTAGEADKAAHRGGDAVSRAEMMAGAEEPVRKDRGWCEHRGNETSVKIRQRHSNS